MADKPYSERTGGSYVRDPVTGKLTRGEQIKKAADSAADAAIPPATSPRKASK